MIILTVEEKKPSFMCTSDRVSPNSSRSMTRCSDGTWPRALQQLLQGVLIEHLVVPDLLEGLRAVDLARLPDDLLPGEHVLTVETEEEEQLLASLG